MNDLPDLDHEAIKASIRLHPTPDQSPDVPPDPLLRLALDGDPDVRRRFPHLDEQLTESPACRRAAQYMKDLEWIADLSGKMPVASWREITPFGERVDPRPGQIWSVRRSVRHWTQGRMSRRYNFAPLRVALIGRRQGRFGAEWEVAPCSPAVEAINRGTAHDETTGTGSLHRWIVHIWLRTLILEDQLQLKQDELFDPSPLSSAFAITSHPSEHSEEESLRRDRLIERARFLSREREALFAQNQATLERSNIITGLFDERQAARFAEQTIVRVAAGRETYVKGVVWRSDFERMASSETTRLQAEMESARDSASRWIVREGRLELEDAETAVGCRGGESLILVSLRRDGRPEFRALGVATVECAEEAKPRIYSHIPSDWNDTIEARSADLYVVLCLPVPRKP